MPSSDAVTRLNAALEGRYEIEREIGEGGMATVYLAKDLKHNRNVALKVLKPELAAVVGADRFLAEIETTANLQHPHILPLFDSGEAGSFLFYVMPYVEGESLREKLDREHQLPVDDAVRIATNVAEALDYAHTQGVIHRDIKPANILLQAGKPVISDFGIALAVGAAGGGRLTETGLSLGTPHYMSPEQATGDLSVGAATDVYALGCVLYEMLVAEPPYTGGTPQAILGKIIAGELASATKHRRSVPANVDAAIRKALEKVPADRFAGAQEFASALVDQSFRDTRGEASIHAPSSARWRYLAAGGWVTAVALAVVVLLTGQDEEGPTPVRFEAGLPPGVNLSVNPHRGFIISPDGQTLVFADDVTGGLYRRDLGQLQAVPIPGPNMVWLPFFSPDGQWVAYFDQDDGALMKVRLDGSDLQMLAPVGGTRRSGAWTKDGAIIFTGSESEGVWRVPDSGGIPEQVLDNDGSELWWLDLLPNDRTVLSGREEGGESRLVAHRLDTGERIDLGLLGSSPRYVETGHLIYANDGALWVVGFDPEGVEVVGQPTQVVQGVRMGLTNWLAHYGVHERALVYQLGETSGGERALVWVDRDGREEAVGLDLASYRAPRLSPEGDRLAVVVLGEDNDIWVIDLARVTRSRITFGGNNRYWPTWEPGGDRILFSDGNTGPNTIQSALSDGSGNQLPFLASDGQQFPTSWSRNGDALAYHETSPETSRDVWVIPAGGEPELFLRTPFNERAAAFSPDADWLAYVSNKSGQAEVYLRPYPGPGAEVVISTDGGWEPVWSPDGSELFYRTRREFMAVSVADPASPGVSAVLFDASLYAMDATGVPEYDVSADGQRFLMVRLGGNTVERPVIVDLNWTARLGSPGSN